MELFNVYSLYPIEPVRGKGCYVYDAAGTEYLDLYGGHAVISIGHAQPDYVRAVQEQKIPHGDIQLCFTIAEEIGCLGVVNLDPKDIRADLGYCLDIGGAPGIVTNSAPRLFDIYFTVKGKSAHAGDRKSVV